MNLEKLKIRRKEVMQYEGEKFSYNLNKNFTKSKREENLWLWEKLKLLFFYLL